MWVKDKDKDVITEKNQWTYATFTLQALVLNSDVLLRSDFLFGCSHKSFLKVANIRVWTNDDAEMTRMPKITITRQREACRCHMEVNMEATEGSIYVFLYMLMCHGSQQIHKQVFIYTVYIYKYIYLQYNPARLACIEQFL